MARVLLIRPGWLASKPQGSTYPCLPCSVITSIHCHLHPYDTGDQTQVAVLGRQTLNCLHTPAGEWEKPGSRCNVGNRSSGRCGRRCCPPEDQEYSLRLTECGLVGCWLSIWGGRQCRPGRRWEPVCMPACVCKCMKCTLPAHACAKSSPITNPCPSLPASLLSFPLAVLHVSCALSYRYP